MSADHWTPDDPDEDRTAVFDGVSVRHWLPDGPGEYEDDQEEMSNERFRALLQRSYLAGDFEATEEVLAYLLGTIINAKARAFPDRSRHDEVVQNLLEAGFKASRTALVKHVERPRNYTVKAINNAYVSNLRAYWRHRETPTDFTASKDVTDPRSGHGHSDVHVRELLKAFRKDVQGMRGQVGTKVADVIELSYLTGMSNLDACRFLNFSPAEIAAVLRTINRWSKNPSSPLWRLIQQIRNDEPPTDHTTDKPKER